MGEIKMQPGPIAEGIANLRSSIQALDTSFAEKIEGENKLDMVHAFNEIKTGYDELLKQFETLFMNNIQATEDAVADFQETERTVAGDIRLMK